jgi:hypothetical protein
MDRGHSDLKLRRKKLMQPMTRNFLNGQGLPKEFRKMALLKEVALARDLRNPGTMSHHLALVSNDARVRIPIIP